MIIYFIFFPLFLIWHSALILFSVLALLLIGWYHFWFPLLAGSLFYFAFFVCVCLYTFFWFCFYLSDLGFTICLGFIFHFLLFCSYFLGFGEAFVHFNPL